METVHERTGKKAVRKSMKAINRKFDGCKGVSIPSDETYFLAVDSKANNQLKIALSLANKLKDVDQDFKLGLKYDRKSRRWNIAVDFPPFSQDLVGVLR